MAQDWPILPSTGFISGRAATEKDVADGNAIFVLKAQGAIIGRPLEVVIPQYAYLNKEGHKQVILVQAEEANGIKLFGIRDATGKEYISEGSDLELLGTKPPR